MVYKDPKNKQQYRRGSMINIMNLPPGVVSILFGLIPGGLMVCGFFIIRGLYLPRSRREWTMLLANREVRAKLRERKKRLDAIRSRKPGAILPGIPTSHRDFALEPLIRNGQFKAARTYIMEQIRRHRDSPDDTGRMSVYVRYLELLEGEV